MGEEPFRPGVRIILGWLIIPGALLLIWQLWANHLEQPWLLPTPIQVGRVLIHPLRDLYASGSWLGNTTCSLIRVLIGFSCAAVLGSVLGIVLGSIPTLRMLFEPLIELLRPLCPIAWMPFAIAVFKLQTVPQLFGITFSNTIFDQVQLGMVFVLFWGAFFPIVVNTLDGVAGVRRNYVSLAWSLGANFRQRFVHVYLPAALPMILTGLRQGMGTCWFVIIAAEMLPGADSGIGYLLMYASDQSGMDVVLACMILIAVIGASLNATMLAATRHLVRWHGREV